MRRTTRIPMLLARRLRVRRVVFALIALLVVSILLGRLHVFGRPAGDDWAVYDRQPFIVTRVSDGDTIEVASKAGATATRIRLLGIDAPEMRGEDGQAQYWADAAKRYAVARSEHKRITLKLEPTQTRDRYGRLLAYVYLSDSESLNLALVRDGQAYADRRFRHTMRFQFEQAEAAARKKGTGLWKDVSRSQMPQWRQRWLHDMASRKAS